MSLIIYCYQEKKILVCKCVTEPYNILFRLSMTDIKLVNVVCERPLIYLAKNLTNFDMDEKRRPVYVGHLKNMKTLVIPSRYLIHVFLVYFIFSFNNLIGNSSTITCNCFCRNSKF